MLGSLLKATVGTLVTTPASMITDVITLGGALTDKDRPYTVDALEDVYENIVNATKPDNNEKR